MHVVLVNVTHPAIGSRIPTDHLPPLGLLAIGGSLIDAGHRVALVDADRVALDRDATVAEVVDRAPDVVLFGPPRDAEGEAMAPRRREARPSPQTGSIAAPVAVDG